MREKFNNSFIYDYTRTAIGGFQGSLSTLKATKLGSIVIKSLLNKNKVNNKNK